MQLTHCRNGLYEVDRKSDMVAGMSDESPRND